MLKREGQTGPTRLRFWVGLMACSNLRLRWNDLDNELHLLPVQNSRRMGYFQLDRGGEVMTGTRLRQVPAYLGCRGKCRDGKKKQQKRRAVQETQPIFRFGQVVWT